MCVKSACMCLALRNAACFAVVLLLAGCATFRVDVERVSSEAWPRPDETALGRNVAERLAASPGQSGFHLLDSGLDAFAARAALAEAAERTLDLQYYIIREDMSAQLLLYEALRAADRGVRVRLLVDDRYAVGKDFDLATYSAHPNIEVRVFNPFLARGPLGLSRLFEFIGSSARLNRRMHNKLWIADNAAAIVGGRNLGDEYFDAHIDAHGEVNFTDLDVLALGPVVRETSKSFDDYWNSKWAVPIEAFIASPPGREQIGDFATALAQQVEQFRDTEYASELRDPRFGRQLRGGELPVVIAPAEVLYDNPAKAVARGEEAQPSPITLSVRARIEGAEREVILISPYLIPSEHGVAMFPALVRRGVRVRVLTNSLASSDTPVVHAAYARYRPRLLAGGVEIYETHLLPASGRARGKRQPGSSGASLHAKAIVVDRRFVVIGSLNLDPRSRLHNTEVAMLIESAELGAQVAKLFEHGVDPADAFRVELAERDRPEAGLVWLAEEDGKPVRYTREPASFWKRFAAGLLSLFAPEHML